MGMILGMTSSMVLIAMVVGSDSMEVEDSCLQMANIRHEFGVWRRGRGAFKHTKASCRSLHRTRRTAVI